MTQAVAKPRKRRRTAARPATMMFAAKAGELPRNAGVLVPADEFSESELRRKRIRRGVIFAVDITEPRDYGQHKFAHKLAGMLAENIEDLSEYQNREHDCIKTIQRRADIECEAVTVVLAGEEFEARQARSICFADMEETAFRALVERIAQWVCDRYWPECEPQDVLDMAAAWERPK